MVTGVSIVVPAKNEAEHLPEVVKRIRKVSKRYEIVVVDDGSTDDTAAIAEKLGCKCIRLDRNHGKSYACRIGAANASNERIVFIDSDLQHDPCEIPKFVVELEDNDIVIGSRDMSALPWQRKMANKFSKRMIRLITRQRFSDVLCGFRAVRKSKFLALDLVKNGYEFESETLIKAIRKGLRVSEVPVDVNYDIGSRMRFKQSLKLSAYLVKQLFFTKIHRHRHGIRCP